VVVGAALRLRLSRTTTSRAETGFAVQQSSGTTTKNGRGSE